jgi:predicted nucleotidyltransferase
MLLEFEPGKKTFDRFMQISFLLEEILQRQIELVTIEALSPYLGPHILNETEDLLAAA